MDPRHELLRHLVATLAYRSARALAGTPQGFAEFRACKTSMSCGEILAHLANLMDWTYRLATGQERGSKPGDIDWNRDLEHFYTMLEKFDEYLASGQALAIAEEKLLQGPIADSLTHVGQLTMLRRMAGAPLPPVNYFKADIQPGHIAEAKAAAQGTVDG